VNDDESADVRWFPLDALPELNPRHLALVQDAGGFDGVARFLR
jgi:8-oxo-dGTP pyrophosphatase MutT (NUDIX family)